MRQIVRLLLKYFRTMIINAFMNATSVHTDGKTEGCDYMKGKNIVVIGTPHYNESVYKLLACHLGINSDCKMRFAEITDYNYKYWLTTYDDITLQTIQLWFIKSELIQAVGRARLLRFNCTVKLYASVPIEQAEILE